MIICSLARIRASLVVSVVSVVSVLAFCGSSSAAVTISGKVQRGAGYTLIVLGESGAGASVKLRSTGKFSVKLRKGVSNVSLQLIDSSGSYFGPVLLRKQGRKGFLTLSSKSVGLGVIRLRDDYAAVVRSLGKKSLNARKYVSLSASGKPAGAGRLGMTSPAKQASAPRRSSITPFADPSGGGTGGGSGGGSGGGDNGGGRGESTAGVDGDRDGIPGMVDADDDGDGLIDAVDPDSSSGDGLFSTLFLNLDQSLNANAGGVTQGAIDAAIRDYMNLVFYMDAKVGTTGASAVDVDCLDLAYCRRTTGTARMSNLADSTTLVMPNAPWISYDPNNNGLPNLPPMGSGGVHALSVMPGVGTGDISPGDTFNTLWRTGSATVSVPTALTMYFVTVPAVQSYNAGAGLQVVSYPATGTPGTDGNPIAMSSNSLTLNFWRPQRAAIPGAETGGMVDMGKLHYGVVVSDSTGEFGCPSDFSGLSSTLSVVPEATIDIGKSLFPLVDSSDDQPVNSASTMAMTVDLVGCLARNGAATTSGSTVRLSLSAVGEGRRGGMDRAVQVIAVRLP